MHISLSSNTIDWAASSAGISNIFLWRSKTLFTRSIVESSAAGVVTSSAGETAAAAVVNDDPVPAEREVGRSGVILPGLPLELDGVLVVEDGSFVSSAASR